MVNARAVIYWPGRKGRGIARLLLVDEDADAANKLAEDLRVRGNAVRTAYSKRQCLELVAEFRPDVVVFLMQARGLIAQLHDDVPVINVAQWKKPVDTRALLRRLRQTAV